MALKSLGIEARERREAAKERRKRAVAAARLTGERAEAIPESIRQTGVAGVKGLRRQAAQALGQSIGGSQRGFATGATLASAGQLAKETGLGEARIKAETEKSARQAGLEAAAQQFEAVSAEEMVMGGAEDRAQADRAAASKEVSSIMSEFGGTFGDSSEGKRRLNMLQAQYDDPRIWAMIQEAMGRL